MSLEDRIVYETDIGYVFKLKKNYFEVRTHRGAVSVSDSAYADESLAIARLNYLTTRRSKD